MWSFSIHTTISGTKLLDVQPSAGSWRRALGGGGSGQHTLQLRAVGEEISPATARQLSEPNQASLVVCWGDVVLYAGAIIKADYKRSTGALTVRHNEGLREILRNRSTFGVGAESGIGAGYAGGDLVVSGRSASGAVRAILHRGAGGYWGGTWDLPIDLPADGAGPISFTWRRWDFHMIDDLLGQIEDLGYEIDFRPYLTAAGALRYQTVVASKITAGLLEFAVTAERTPVTELSVSRDGSKQLSGVFTLGKGSEDKMLKGGAGFMDGPVIPVRDAVVSMKDVANVSRLNEMATAELTQRRHPSEQWDFSLVAEVDEDGVEQLDVAALIPGATMRMLSSGDEYITDGVHPLRLVGISGDMSRTLKPEVQ
ncbi:hypothetical protein WDU99_01860 [Microbacterium sp. Mu-80]|uniref:Uncharacterized protein n=1 Tax=Microbacterium bandirmense TaxID=3122050 RepID=A0ABU8L6V7_9MICO